MLKLLKIGVEIFLVSISENTTCRKPKKLNQMKNEIKCVNLAYSFYFTLLKLHLLKSLLNEYMYLAKYAIIWDILIWPKY